MNCIFSGNTDGTNLRKVNGCIGTYEETNYHIPLEIRWLLQAVSFWTRSFTHLSGVYAKAEEKLDYGLFGDCPNTD